MSTRTDRERAARFTWGTGRSAEPETNRCPWCGARIYRNSYTCRFCTDLPRLDRLSVGGDEKKAERESEPIFLHDESKGRAA